MEGRFNVYTIVNVEELLDESETTSDFYETTVIKSNEHNITLYAVINHMNLH